ncbi:DUF6900 domain-containing protein [Caballeronia glathei]|jgi:hypothetical protein|uniref:DUF6900 domain-containing protein n=1 Tax=Caballeronia glathei TaxID=60547 RepID=A0A069PFB0_9BURK|nr:MULTISPECIES: hypothetical protein [Burkholderiaceae]KDR39378.1 hypothetical protein BG61_33220 [Caballeronia glathei]
MERDKTIERLLSGDREVTEMSMIMESTRNDAREEVLRTISNEVLGIESFEPTGAPSAGFRTVSVRELGRALEAAYEAGLFVGRAVGYNAL